VSDLEAEVERNVREWLAAARSSPERPVALEVLWDGDTEGWYVTVALVSRRARHRFWSIDHLEPPWQERHLASLRYGGDIRLFQGTVPPWPEAVVAQRAGRRVAAELGIDYHFPAPEGPDDDCPHWWDRDHAVRCRTCGKLLAPGCPAADAQQCRPCEIEEEHRRQVVVDEPGSPDSGTVSFVREVEGRLARGGMLGLHPRHAGPLLDAVRSVLRERDPPELLTARIEGTLTPAERESVSRWCAERIDRQLEAYTPRPGLPRFADIRRAITWRGVERSIQARFNEVGEEVLSLLHWHALLDPAAPGVVHMLGNAGVTARDLSILAKARAGADTVAKLQAAFPFLEGDALERTLAKLAARRFIARADDGLELLLKGRVIDLRGPAE